MDFSFRHLLAILVFIGLTTGGCVAQKSSTVHPTLKGDNSVTPAPAQSVDLPDSGFTLLSDLTDRFSRDLAKEAAGRKVYLDRANIRDVNTGDVARFSSYLQNDLEASLSQTFQLAVLPDEADLLLGASFQRYGNQMRIFFKYHTPPDFSVRKSLDYGIELARLPEDSRRENLHSKAGQLAANIIEDDLAHKIYIKPFESASCKCVAPFSRTFANLVKTQIVRMHRQVEIVDERPVKAKLSDTRSIKKKVKEVKELATADAVFADANAVLEGEYVVNGDQVMVTLLLKDLDGHVLNSTNVDIDRALITIPLVNKTAATVADLADRKAESDKKTVKLSTSRSGDHPVYRAGEKIVFYAQVKEPLYLYIYDITSEGEVALLYPYTAEFNHRMTYPDRLVAIPDEGDDFELFVEPPFGVDAIKVFASPIELPVPTLSSGVATRSYTSSGTRAVGKRRKKVQNQLAGRTQINPKDLVDYYRGLKDRFKIEIYEDSLVLETKR